MGALVWLTWDQSIRDRLGNLTGRAMPDPGVTATAPPPPAPTVRYVTRPAPTPSGQWMWDPAHRSALDRPAYNSQDKSQRYLDAEGRSYWYDAQGVRHYDP